MWGIQRSKNNNSSFSLKTGEKDKKNKENQGNNNKIVEGRHEQSCYVGEVEECHEIEWNVEEENHGDDMQQRSIVEDVHLEQNELWIVIYEEGVHEMGKKDKSKDNKAKDGKGNENEINTNDEDLALLDR